ncbi:MAG: TRAP transporter substrate-binding protein [candidate division NC10 bacterium]|nr:TRAP transporter substrate-binding protein [candidate division NC10 bacterium]
MNRRTFLKSAGVGAAATALAAPNVWAKPKTYRWRMVTTWPPGLPFYQVGNGSAEGMAKRIEEMSGGRIKIRVYAAKELIPAFGGFDAVSKGTVEMNHGVAYYWSGKRFASQYFGTIPFGMNPQGANAWYYEGGGIQLWEEIYKDFNLVPMPCGNTGIQMTGWFNKQIKSVKDLKGLKMRIPGLAGKVLAEMGVNVVLLPGGEIFPALERGVIDAAEWVGPYQDRRLGLYQAAKYYYHSGWHEPSTTSELIINQKAWDSLDKDLQAIIRGAAAEANVRAISWADANNAAALDDMVKNKNVKLKLLPKSVIEELRKVTKEVLADKNVDPLSRKVYASYKKFQKDWSKWAGISEGTYHKYIRA